MSEFTPRYAGWNSEFTIKAKSRKYVSYDTLIALLGNWREVRLGVLEHVNTILGQASKLGETNFYSRTKRFGSEVEHGDKLFVSLNEARIKKIINNIIIALQAIKGEGRAMRLAGKEAQPTTSGVEDSALNVAHQLAELDELLVEDTFLEESCYTQRKFELSTGLRWVEKE
nr:MAG: putative coat protein [Inner Mongolia sediment virgavirus 1]